MAFRFTLATAFVRLALDDAAFARGLDNQRRRLLRFGTGLAFGAGGFTAGLVIAAGKAASAAQEMEQRFNQVFRNLRHEAKAFSVEFATGLDRSFHTVMETMSKFQIEFTAQGMGRGQALQMSKDLTVLTSDLAAFHNMADEDVGSRLFRALVGNHRALYELGIVLNQAALEQAALNEGFTEGFKDLAPLEKMQVRFAYIMRASADAAGQAKREMGFLASQWRQMTDGIKELSIEVGQSLTPALLGAVQHAKELVAAIRELSGSGVAKAVGGTFMEGLMTTKDAIAVGVAALTQGVALGDAGQMMRDMADARQGKLVRGVSGDKLAKQRDERDKRNLERDAAARGAWIDAFEQAKGIAAFFQHSIEENAKIEHWRNTRGPLTAWISRADSGADAAKEERDKKLADQMEKTSKFFDPIAYVKAIQESIKGTPVEKQQLKKLEDIDKNMKRAADALDKFVPGSVIQPDVGIA